MSGEFVAIVHVIAALFAVYGEAVKRFRKFVESIECCTRKK